MIEKLSIVRRENIDLLKKIILTEDGQKNISEFLGKIRNQVGKKFFCHEMFEEYLKTAYLEAKKEQEEKTND
jgi:hypothetical protein